MDKRCKTYETYVQVLRDELVPAMGCTEPIAVAFCAAKAKDALGEMPDKVDIKVSGNIISIHVADAGVSDPSEMTTYSDVISLGFMAGLVNSADRAEFITAGEAAEQSGRDSIDDVPEIGRLYMDLKDGSQLELRLLEGGYVYFPEIPEAALILPENAMATVQNLMGN